MEMTMYAQAIKNELITQLNKQGSSLQEFEESLQQLCDGDGVYKAAKIGSRLILSEKKASGLTGMAYDAAKALPEVAFKGSLGLGAAAGLTFDEMDKSVDSVNKALEREREKINLVRRLTENLKKEHGLV